MNISFAQGLRAVIVNFLAFVCVSAVASDTRVFEDQQGQVSIQAAQVVLLLLSTHL